MSYIRPSTKLPSGKVSNVYAIVPVDNPSVVRIQSADLENEVDVTPEELFYILSSMLAQGKWTIVEVKEGKG